MRITEIIQVYFRWTKICWKKKKETVAVRVVLGILALATSARVGHSCTYRSVDHERTTDNTILARVARGRLADRSGRRRRNNCCCSFSEFPASQFRLTDFIDSVDCKSCLVVTRFGTEIGLRSENLRDTIASYRKPKIFGCFSPSSPTLP